MLDFVLGLIGTLLYPLFSIIFVCVDSIQLIFNAFAGIGSITFGGQSIDASGTIDAANPNKSETSFGIINYLFQNDLVKNMLFSIMILALFLMIIFTVMAFIKNAYAAKQKGWKDIIGLSIKGLANFIFIPVCCVLGVMLANIVLQAINGATSVGGASKMSRKLFVAAAYNANEFRKVNDEQDEEGLTWADMTADAQKVTKLKTWAAKQKLQDSDKFYDASKIETGKTNEYYATIVDEIYSTTNVSIYEQFSVGKWYQVWSINYLVLIVGGIFMLYVLCALAFAMVRRLFMLIILFIISPGVCAMYPIDEGKAVGSWKSEFIKLVLSAYGAVAGMNIFFSLMPLVDKIELGTGAGNFALNFSGINTLVQIFILIVGLLCVKEVIALISGFIGGEDALNKGTSLMKQAQGAAKKYGGGAIRKGVGVFTKGISNIKHKGWGAGTLSNLKGAGKSAVGLTKVFGLDIEKDIKDPWNDARKAAKQEAGEEKTIRQFKSDINGAKGSYETKTQAEASARASYENLKNNRPAGMSDADYESALRSARGKIGASAKASKKARRDLDSVYSSVREDFKGWSVEKLAKKLGVSTDDLKDNMSAGNEVVSTSIKYRDAQNDAQAMTEALELAQKRNSPGDWAKVEELFGADIRKLATTLGKSIDDLVDLFKGGVKFDVSTFSTDKEKIAGTAFNRAVDKQERYNDILEETKKAYGDMVLAQNGKFINSSGQIVKFSDADISALKDALKSGDASDIESTKIVTTIREETRKQEQAVAAQLLELKDIRKAMSDMNKKK